MNANKTGLALLPFGNSDAKGTAINARALRPHLASLPGLRLRGRSRFGAAKARGEGGTIAASLTVDTRLDLETRKDFTPVLTCPPTRFDAADDRTTTATPLKFPLSPGERDGVWANRDGRSPSHVAAACPMLTGNFRKALGLDRIPVAPRIHPVARRRAVPALRRREET